MQKKNVQSKPKHMTVVCVTNQYRCERLIKAGRAIADLTDTGLLVVNAQSAEYAPDPQALQYLFDVSGAHDSEMTVLYTEDPYKALVRFISSNRAVNVITGMPRDGNSVIFRLWDKYTHIKFFIIDEAGDIREVTDKSAYRTNP